MLPSVTELRKLFDSWSLEAQKLLTNSVLVEVVVRSLKAMKSDGLNSEMSNLSAINIGVDF